MLTKGDALIVIDVQRDFCPGGALAIRQGDAVVPVLNRWIAAAVSKGLPVYASRDWHPVGHVSFSDQGGSWPPHCIQDTEGARFHPDLQLPISTVIVTKGVRLDCDQLSAFDHTGLAEHLRREQVGRVWIGGLAEDVCVLATVLDARREGFKAFIVRDATRPVTLDGGRKAEEVMRDAGAAFIDSYGPLAG